MSRSDSASFRPTPPPTPASGRRSLLPDLAAAGLLVLFAWLALSASRHWSHTSDELPHITAGFAYDHFGDFRLQPENGVLPQRVHGLAPLLLGARPPDNQLLWENSQVWQLGWDFFYSMDNPLDRMLFLARALNICFGVGLGIFLYVVSRRWHGPAGGLVTLALFCLSPEFLFHSAQATSDVAGTLFLLLASWLFWQQLAQRDARSCLFAGLASGCAVTAKFSGLLIAPIFAALLIADIWLRAPAGGRGRRLALNVGALAGTTALALAVIWTLYGFRFSARADALPPIAQFSWPWGRDLQFAGFKGQLIAQALSLHLLPEAYLRGLDYVLASESARPAFLAGQYSTTGWWQFFPTLFLTKTTLALLLATTAVAIGGFIRLRPVNGEKFRALAERWAPLAIAALITWGAALHSTLNIGHRHILTVYPPLFVAAGSMALWVGRWRWTALAVCALQSIESQSIRPHYLAYFNPLWGPQKAYRLAVDSSLDWGQDLPALSAWLKDNRQPGEKLYLSYFGNAWPPHYGVRPTIFLPAVNLVAPPLQPYELQPGLYCVSATSLSEVYSQFKGPWTERWAAEWQQPPSDYDYFVRLRFARLCKYLQGRTPDAFAGYSILVFRLSAAELDIALHGPVLGWRPPEPAAAPAPSPHPSP